MVFDGQTSSVGWLVGCDARQRRILRHSDDDESLVQVDVIFVEAVIECETRQQSSARHLASISRRVFASGHSILFCCDRAHKFANTGNPISAILNRNKKFDRTLVFIFFIQQNLNSFIDLF